MSRIIKNIANHPRNENPILILFGFESNSGGQVPNSDATEKELSPTTSVRILNPITLSFENLHIGVNENLDHANLLPHTTHGWHLQLKNRMEAGSFVSPKLYICEFGQGGSVVASWSIGSNYANKMVARYNAAYSGIVSETGQEPTVFMFNSFGINDALAGTVPSTFKAAYLELLDRINSIHSVSAYMVDVIFDIFPTYITVINEMPNDRSNIYLQNMQGKQQQDAYHLGYQGMKDMTDEKCDVVVQLLRG